MPIPNNKKQWILPEGEYLEVRWNSVTDYDIHFKRFNRMGALLDWVERNDMKVVALTIYKRTKDDTVPIR